MPNNTTTLTKQDTTLTFADIYYLKKSALMVASLLNKEHFADDQFEIFKGYYGDVKDGKMLLLRFDDFKTSYIEDGEFLPPSVKELWDDLDYEVYTDKFYHRKMWNEIPNDDATEYFLEKLCECKGVSTDDDEKFKFIIELYDFNNYCLFFETEEDAEAFADENDIVPYTLFEKDADGKTWNEVYSA